MGKKTSIWILIFIIFVLSIICGYYVAKNIKLRRIISSREQIEDNKISEEEIKRLEAAKIVNSKEEKIGTNTRVVLRTNYTLCGHTKEEEIDKTSVVNLTKDELQKLYHGCEIREFSEDKVDLEKSVDGICEEHYIVTEEEGNVVVYRRKSNEEIEKYMTTDISVDFLPQEDSEKLEQGEEIYSWEELNKFLEDYE